MDKIASITKINKRETELGLVGTPGSWHASYRDSAYIYAGGLDSRLTEGDVICIFSQVGEIFDCNLVRDKDTGKSKGFAFIGYEDQRSTDLAIDNFCGAVLLDKTLCVDHCDYAQNKKDTGERDEDGNKILEAKGPNAMTWKTDASIGVRKYQSGSLRTQKSKTSWQHEEEIVDKAKKKAEKLEKKVKKEEKKQRKAEKKLNKATKKELKKQLKMQRDLGILSEEDDSEDDTDTDPVPKSLLKTENQRVKEPKGVKISDERSTAQLSPFSSPSLKRQTSPKVQLQVSSRRKSPSPSRYSARSRSPPNSRGRRSPSRNDRSRRSPRRDHDRRGYRSRSRSRERRSRYDHY
eukprot:TRINITY_DN40777_c0_g1_i1.p1 TRINITY_DN40777_c0_g1~~TRINITY_DN40777_c0_g1_i1.p1  ORF type:complete len:349 (+),score=67.23 TRINITY_DN40777_c0_g1_i1:150-1196(+)